MPSARASTGRAGFAPPGAVVTVFQVRDRASVVFRHAGVPVGTVADRYGIFRWRSRVGARHVLAAFYLAAFYQRHRLDRHTIVGGTPALQHAIKRAAMNPERPRRVRFVASLASENIQHVLAAEDSHVIG